MKKIFSVLLSLIFVFLMLSISFNAYANTDGTLAVGNVAVKPGEEITVPVVYNGNPGFAAAGVNITYNKDVISVLGADNGEVSGFQITEGGEPGEYAATLLINGMKDIKQSGVLFLLKIKVNENAKAGKYDLKLTSKYGVCNMDEQMLKPTLTSGSVTVPCIDHNFADGDVCTVCGGIKQTDGKVTFKGTNEDGTAAETANFNANYADGSIIDNTTEEDVTEGKTVKEISPSDKNSDINSETENGKNGNLLIVFCIIGAVVIIGAAVAFFVISKKRKQK